MPARRGDLQRPLDRFLPLHVGKVGAAGKRGGGDPGLRRREENLALQMGHQLPHVLHRIDRRPARQGGLGGGGGRDIEGAHAGAPGGQRHGQHTGHRPQGAGQGQLSHKGRVGRGRPDLLPGGQDAHQDGQVVHRARLPPVGGSQIHGDAGDGKGEAAVFDGGADPLPGLLHRRVGQAHDIKGGQAAGQVALGGDLVSGNAAQAQRTHMMEHKAHRPSSAMSRKRRGQAAACRYHGRCAAIIPYFSAKGRRNF